MNNAWSNMARWTGLLLLVLVAFGPAFLVATFSIGGRNTGNDSPVLAAAHRLVHYAGGLGLMAYLLWQSGRRPADIGLSFRPTDVLWSVVLAVAGYVAYCLVYYALYEPNRSLMEASAEEGFQLMLQIPIPLLLGVIVVNPVFEELIGRAYLMTEVEHLSGSRVVAIFASAIIQAYYHLYQGWRFALGFFAFFLIFSVYFALSRRAVPIILAHLYFDALAFYQLWRSAHPD